ncbi:MAG: hypothetical protein KAY24_11990 [Candidatus Eisenbacteria sp.]|nr:hypothetical protein [Candidatus Eisenbacteria bacterium]
MGDVSNLNQVLSQTEIIERIQEGAKRRGEIEQQQKTREVVDKVDIQGRQVDETPESREKKVDPEGKDKEREGSRKGEEHRAQDQPSGAPTSERETDSLTEEEGKGRVIDLEA